MGTFGIDLGTTYSCISTLDRNGNPEIIKNQADNTDTLASVVFFENDNNIVVGEAAKERIETDGDRVVDCIKRQIGKPDAKTYTFFDKTYTPTDISSLILKRIKQMAEEQGYSVEDVVITCPAYFGFEELEETRKAGMLAGMNVLSVIAEPTAAALSYCARQFQEERTIMVYDLGGGTFDVTILKMSMDTNAEGQEVQKVKVITTGGDDLLGGKDWDDRLVEYVTNACCTENGISVEELDHETHQLIRSRVENAKKKLTNLEETSVKVNINNSMTKVKITREEFENLTADLVQKTMSYVEKTIRDAGNIPIDTVLLVGGSSFMPMIKNAVEQRFPGIVQFEDPNHAVAKGAAVYSSILVESVKAESPDKETASSSGAAISVLNPIEVVDRTPRSFGPGVLDEKNEYIIDNLIKINSEMPVEETRSYYAPKDNIPAVELRAFENMNVGDRVTPCIDMEGKEQYSDPADKVKCIGTLHIDLPAGTPKGTEFKVTFRVENREIYIEAVNVSTGEPFSTKIRIGTDVDVENSVVNQIAIRSETED